jgi:surface carbohydrate biosynthesis protein
MGDALIAHELDKLGIDCHLEPLQSWQAAVYAYQPHFVLYNHLTSQKLADFTQELKNSGILVGCMLNEGLCYEKSDREFVSKKQFPDVNCDLFLTWNDSHRDCLIEHGFCTPPENVRTIGVPRFDFYKQPWSETYRPKEPKADQRPVLLVNTTFALAHFQTLPQKHADQFFEPWKDKINGLQDYMAVINAHYVSRQMLPAYLEELLKTLEYRIILRPHPREEISFYQDWLATLPADQRELITLETQSRSNPPFTSIIEADVVLNCEDCTTALEAWMADKPTISIALSQFPFWFTDTYKRLSPIADKPENIVEKVKDALAAPAQSEYTAARRAHMQKWLGGYDGRSAQRAAREIHDLIVSKNTTPRIPFTFAMVRKKWKLFVLHAFNEPYTFQPKHFIRRKFKGKQEQVSIKYRNYLKSVRPSDVTFARDQLKRLDSSTQPGPPPAR